MRKAFAVLATLLLLVVVAEFFFAASGGFSSEPDGEAYRFHHALGYVIFLLPAVMAIVAAPAGMPGRLIGMTVLVSGLTGLQVVLAKLGLALADSGDSTLGTLISGAHGINGLIMLAVVVMIVQRARTLSRASAAVGG